jgi:hypothetical protein
MIKECKYCKKKFSIKVKKQIKYWGLYCRRKFCSNSCLRKYYRHILKKDNYKPNYLKTKKEILSQRKRINSYYYRYLDKNRKRLSWNNPKRKTMDKKRRKERRLLVLQKYSKNNIPFCKCCKDKHLEFLTIDHINGGGNKHLKTISMDIYSFLIKNNYPTGFRVLCMNCNWARRFNKKCPHQK